MPPHEWQTVLRWVGGDCGGKGGGRATDRGEEGGGGGEKMTGGLAGMGVVTAVVLAARRGSLFYG